jgi:hypothetical protein
VEEAVRQVDQSVAAGTYVLPLAGDLHTSFLGV